MLFADPPLRFCFAIAGYAAAATISAAADAAMPPR